MKYRPSTHIAPKRSPNERRTATKAVFQVCQKLDAMGFQAIPVEGSIKVDRAIHVVADTAFSFPAGPVLTATFNKAERERGVRIPVGVVVTRRGRGTRAIAALDLDDLLELLHAWDERSTQVAARARRLRDLPAPGESQPTDEGIESLPRT